MQKILNIKNLLFLSIAFIFFVIGYLASYSGFPSEYATISTLCIVLLAIPSFYYFLKSSGTPGIIFLIALMLFSLVFEGQALFTGFPYSEFSYSDKIAGKLFGIIPWTIAFAWTPLLLASATLFQKYLSSFPKFTFFTATYLVCIDLSLDPAATAAGLWSWLNPVGFYGVPFQNFFGWFVSGVLGASIFWIGCKKFKLHKFQKEIIYSSILNLFFWTGSILYFDYKIVLLIAIGLIIHQLNYVLTR